MVNSEKSPTNQSNFQSDWLDESTDWSTVDWDDWGDDTSTESSPEASASLPANAQMVEDDLADARQYLRSQDLVADDEFMNLLRATATERATADTSSWPSLQSLIHKHFASELEYKKRIANVANMRHYFADEKFSPAYLSHLSQLIMDDRVDVSNIYYIGNMKEYSESERLECLDYLGRLRDNDEIIMENGEKRASTKSFFVSHYFSTHGIDAKREAGFDQFFTMLEKDDPELNGIDKKTNSWGTLPGQFGITDYKIHALISEVNPHNTRDLMQIYRTIPTSDFQKFEQNRLDALAIAGTVIHSRDFIHDERPGVHEILSAMLDYYDASTASPEDFAAKTEALQDVTKRYQKYDSFDGCFDLKKYDTVINRTVKAGNQPSEQYDEKVVDILRRLVANTNPDTLTPPETTDATWNQMFQNLDIRINQKTGEVSLDWREIGNLVSYTNDKLVSRQGQLGMRPSDVQALSFVERIATYAMRGIDSRDWRELPYDPNFKEICKFRELTGSYDKFSETDFNRFWHRFENLDYDATTDEVSAHYRQLSQRIMNQCSKLAQSYATQPNSAYLADSLYSGNLTHELMGLHDPR